MTLLQAAEVPAKTTEQAKENPDINGLKMQDTAGERKITLTPDDVPAFPDPPNGFDVRRDAIPHGRMELIEYDSKTVAVRRRMTVYTPPGYSTTQKYPVLYALHGIGGDETEWPHYVLPDVILDNLLADGKIIPMIVVMPNGRASPEDKAPRNPFSKENAAAFANFERDLLDDVIPTIEARYSVKADRDHRGLCGLSMGGGQTLNFGLGHPEMFSWIGAFSPAPNAKPPAQLLPDPSHVKLKLLWLSCGRQDGLLSIAQNIHTYLKQNNIAHIWHVDSHAHDTPEWRCDLYHFSQLVFK